MGIDEMKLLIESRVNEFNKDSAKVDATYEYNSGNSEVVLREYLEDNTDGVVTVRGRMKTISIYELSSMMNPRGYLDWVLDDMRRRILNG